MPDPTKKQKGFVSSEGLLIDKNRQFADSGVSNDSQTQRDYILQQADQALKSGMSVATVRKTS